MASRRRCPVLTDARGFREEEKGREEGETGGGEGKGVELGFEDGATGLLLWRGKVARGPDGGGGGLPRCPAFGVEAVTTTPLRWGRRGRGGGLLGRGS